MESFTQIARAAIADAQVLAREDGSNEVRPAHLLEALVTSPGAAAAVLAGLGAPGEEVVRVVRGLSAEYAEGFDADDAEALAAFGIDLEAVLAQVDATGAPAGRPVGRRGRQRWSRGAKRAIECALREAEARG